MNTHIRTIPKLSPKKQQGVEKWVGWKARERWEGDNMAGSEI